MIYIIMYVQQIYILYMYKSGIFPSTFLWPVNGSKNSILN